MKPFETLDISDKLITHNVRYYAKGHATEPDTFNAPAVALETALQSLEIPSTPENIEKTESGLLSIAELQANSIYCSGDLALVLPPLIDAPNNILVPLFFASGSSGTIEINANFSLKGANHTEETIINSDNDGAGSALLLSKFPNKWVVTEIYGFWRIQSFG